MEPTNNTQNANVNVVNPSQTASNDTLKGMAYVLAHASDLAGSKVENLYAKYRKSFFDRVKKHTQFNGRMIDLCADVKNPTERQLLNSTEFKVNTRLHCPNYVLVGEMRDGEVVAQHVLLAKQVKVTAGNTGKIARLDNEVIKKYSSAIKSGANISLLGYSHNGEFTACTDYAALEHTVKCEVACTQEYTAADGSKIEAPIYIVDEEGKKTVKTRTEDVVFYPVLDETITPKAFINAVDKALSDMWLLLFPAKQGEQAADAEAAK